MSFRQLEEMVARADAGEWCPRAHVQVGRVTIYARVTRRVVSTYLGGAVGTIDLASIDVDPKYRGQGNFTKWLSKIEKLAKDSGRVVYVESVINPRLRMFLKKRGYGMSHTGDYGFCYHWPPQ